MEKNISYLKEFSPKRAKQLNNTFKSWLKNKIQNEKFVEALREVLSNPPPGFFPEEKLLRTINKARKAGADGVVIFAAGIIQRNKLWQALEKAFTR